jgi:anti-anti-sigma factor
MVAREQDPHRTLKLAGDINVFLAAELHRCCVQISEGASSVAVECNQVTSLDVAAIQMLVALKDALGAQGGTLDISGLSEEVGDIIHVAGLESRLEVGGGSATRGDTE